MKLKVLIAVWVALSSMQLNAFTLDKIFIIADKKGNGIVTLNNDEDNAIFVHSKIQEITVKDDNDIIKKEYTRENINDWKISLTQSKVVLQPGETKDIGVRSLCLNTTCDDSRDQMFLLPFIPSAYNGKNDVKNSGVSITYGFSALYIIPTLTPVFDYKIKNKGDKLNIKNDSNTLIYVLLDTCEDQVDKRCKQRFTVVAGRHKTFNLPKTLQNNILRATITSHDGSYRNEINLPISRIQ